MRRATCNAHSRVKMDVASSTAARVRKRRAALQEAGLRRVQIWVPHTRRPGFAEECRRQSRFVAAADRAEARRSWTPRWPISTAGAVDDMPRGDGVAVSPRG